MDLRSSLAPTLIVLLIGLPLGVVFVRAVADAEIHRREAPLRAVLGDSSFEALMRGERSPQHYLGNELLAPDFTLKDRHGRPWRLHDQRGKLVVMNFWTITCPPCVEEIPSLATLAEVMRGRQDAIVVSISTDAGWDEISRIMPPGSQLKVLFDPEKKVVRDKYGTRLFPETWVIDRRGVIRLRVDGARDWSDALSLEVIEMFL